MEGEMKHLIRINTVIEHQSVKSLTHDDKGESLVLEQKPQPLEAFRVIFQHCLAKRAQKRGSQLFPPHKALNNRLDLIRQ